MLNARESRWFWRWPNETGARHGKFFPFLCADLVNVGCAPLISKWKKEMPAELRRNRRNIPALARQSQPLLARDEKLLGRFPDSEQAKQLNRSLGSVQQRRFKLGVRALNFRTPL
jgi:hypothetical protein